MQTNGGTCSHCARGTGVEMWGQGFCSCLRKDRTELDAGEGDPDGARCFCMVSQD